MGSISDTDRPGWEVAVVARSPSDSSPFAGTALITIGEEDVAAFVHLTPDDARQLAALLTNAADLIEGRQ